MATTAPKTNSFKDFFFDTVNRKNLSFIGIATAWGLLVFFLPYNEWFLKGSIGLIDVYWLGALITAACYSAQSSGETKHFPLPPRFGGLVIFIIFSIMQVRIFGQIYHSMPYGFSAGECDYLYSQWDAYFLSFGTMSTIDIVDYTPITFDAKFMKAYQVLSNIIQFFTIFPLLLARFSTFKDAARMPKETPDYNGKKITGITVNTITGYSGEYWCEIVHLSTPDIDELVNNENITINGSFPEMTLSCTEGVDFNLSFDFKNKKISISRFFIQTKDQAIAPKLSKTIISKASKKGFKVEKPTSVTEKDSDDEPKLNLLNCIKSYL